MIAGAHELEALPAQSPRTFNLGHELRRVNATLIFESLDDGGAEALVEREAAAVRLG